MTKFLSSDANPDGHRLENILRAIRKDILMRCDKIVNDTRPEAEQVVANNTQILAMLTDAIHLAEDSTQILTKAFGPSGDKPRIGS